MAVEASMKEAVLRVSEALHRFAESKGWQPETYRIFMTVNLNWSHINVTFISDRFDPDREAELQDYYDDIMDYLEEDLKEEPDLYRTIGLVLRRFDGYAWFASPQLGPAEVEIDDALLNPGVEDFRHPYRPENRRTASKGG